MIAFPRFQARLLLATSIALFAGSVSVYGQGMAQGQNRQAQTQQAPGTGGGGGGNQAQQAQLGSVNAAEAPGLEFGQLSEQMGGGFVGQRNPDVFVGANQVAMNAGQAQTRNFQQVNRGQNPNQFNQPLQTTRGAGVRAIQYRAPHRIAFTTPPTPSRSVNLNLARKIENLSSRQSVFSGVVFNVAEDNTVTLTGTVNSESDRQLANLYMKMEPGVGKIVDELIIEPQTLQGSLTPLNE
jgi:hypothetical protein